VREEEVPAGPADCPFRKLLKTSGISRALHRDFGPTTLENLADPEDPENPEDLEDPEDLADLSRC
jgi:hypothetical protein